MAENKRYYWIKLSGDFFRDKLIKKLRQIAGGDTFVICYLKMLILATENGGKLYYDGLEDDFSSELALDIDEDVENVSVTVAYLLRHGILVANDSVEYELLTVREMSGSETDSARRMRKHRMSQSDALVSQSDYIKSKKKEKELKQIQSESESKSTGAPTLEEVRAYAAEIGFPGNPERFFNHYESTGWKTATGNPIADWKAKLRYWMDDERKKPSNFGTILEEDFGQRRTTGNPFLDSLMDDQAAAESSVIIEE